MKHTRKVELLKDIVIPKGTILEERFGCTQYGSDCFQHIFGISNDTSGTITYGIDTGDPEMKKWFRDMPW